jgi:hypothetical protein
MKTFVFEGTEVSLTGREAKREAKNPAGKVVRTMTQVEIEPVDKSIEWKKWVDPAVLFEVQSKEKDES